MAKIAFKPESIVALDVYVDKKVDWAGIDYVRGDAENLPFRDAAFDFVYSVSVLEHLKHPSRGIQEHCRTSSDLIMVQIPNLHYWVEIHTMVPLLAFYPRWLRRIISERRSVFYLNYDVGIKLLLKNLKKNSRIFAFRRLYLSNIMKLLIQPHGYQVIAKKAEKH
jgi:2-polyprenyl-3-methyl-5-hydroxy-6-metoxy-1,4-benzoquinol methylase